MFFLKHQAQARRHTVWLVCLYMLASAVTIALTAFGVAISLNGLLHGMWFDYLDIPTAYYVYSALGVALLVTGMVLGRLKQLGQGGYVVAKALGGERLIPAQATFNERRLLNIVEEMALSSGVPVPKIYILPDLSINAFAAGMTRRDTVIGITRGALEAFDRSELQAVIAHEFSHILNGDVRMNMRLSGWLYGLQAISTAGRFLLILGNDDNETRRSSRRRSEKQEGSLAVLVFLPLVCLGIALLVIGFIGSLFAGWIQAAVSRQREYLADASAVQFTRDNEGIASALYKIAVAPVHRLQSFHAAEYAHFMFDSIHDHSIFDKLAATHPPLLSRIERVNPGKARMYAPRMRRAAKHGRVNLGNSTAAFGGSAEAAVPDKWALLEHEFRQQTIEQQREPVRLWLLNVNPDFEAQQRALFRNKPLWEDALCGGENVENLLAVWWLLAGGRLPENHPATNHALLAVNMDASELGHVFAALLLQVAGLSDQERKALLDAVAAWQAVTESTEYARWLLQYCLGGAVLVYGNEHCNTLQTECAQVLAFFYRQSGAPLPAWTSALSAAGLPQNSDMQPVDADMFQVALKRLQQLSAFDRRSIFNVCRHMAGTPPTLPIGLLLDYVAAVLLLNPAVAEEA